jgi:hypothetical protein
VLAKHLRAQGKKSPHRLVQIYRDDAVSLGAAKALTLALANSGIQIEDHILRGQDSVSLSGAFKKLSRQDSVMLWLRPTDLRSLNDVKSKHLPSVAYASGFLAEENAVVFPKSWKPLIRWIYPYEIDKKRQTNVATMKAWLKTWNLPLVNEALQSEVFFNLLFLTDMTSQMLDNLYRDYLVERAEDMLSWGTNSSIYPHLSLSRSQRFSSKGAYIARIAPDGKLKADSEWIVP